MSAAARFGLSLLALAGASACGDRGTTLGAGRAPTSGAPPASAPPPSEAPRGPSCTEDAECTPGWHPSMAGCVPPDRCVDGHCGPPAAITGAADGATGRVVFETAEGPRSFQVELARTGFETQRGLMCRSSMQRDWGMLFFMGETRVQSFWMFNTLIPLDILFLDDDWRLVGVSARAEPLTRSPRSVGQPSRYVLELVSGMAAEAGLVPGTQARFYPPRGQ